MEMLRPAGAAYFAMARHAVPTFARFFRPCLSRGPGSPTSDMLRPYSAKPREARTNSAETPEADQNLPELRKSSMSLRFALPSARSDFASLGSREKIERQTGRPLLGEDYHGTAALRWCTTIILNRLFSFSFWARPNPRYLVC